MSRDPLRISSLVAAACSFSVVIAAWEVGSDTKLIPAYLMPSPLAILREFDNEKLSLLYHAAVTAGAIAVSFVIGLFLGGVFAAVSFRWRNFRLMAEPILVTFQVVPKVALAPMLMIAMGAGIAPTIVLGVLICFFPIYVNLSQGFASASDEVLLQAKLLEKSSFELTIIRGIYAVPYLVAGSKTGILLATIGVVVGEMLAGSKGLGYQIAESGARFQTELMYASILALSAIAGFLYLIVVFLGRKAIRYTRLDPI